MFIFVSVKWMKLDDNETALSSNHDRLKMLIFFFKTMHFELQIFREILLQAMVPATQF